MTKPYNVSLQLTLEQHRGLPLPEQSKIHHIALQSPLFIHSSTSTGSNNHRSCVLLYTFTEGNHHVHMDKAVQTHTIRGSIVLQRVHQGSESDMQVLSQNPESPFHPFALGVQNLDNRCEMTLVNKTRMFINLQWEVYLLTWMDIPVSLTKSSSSQRQATLEAEVPLDYLGSTELGQVSRCCWYGFQRPSHLSSSSSWQDLTTQGMEFSCQPDEAFCLPVSFISLYAPFLINHPY